MLTPKLLQLFERVSKFAYFFGVIPYEWTEENFVLYPQGTRILCRFTQLLMFANFFFQLIRFAQASLTVEAGQELTILFLQVVLVLGFSLSNMRNLFYVFKETDLLECLNQTRQFFTATYGNKTETRRSLCTVD